ncbi:hypothetical protein LINGRAHAP2_LOCUS15796 [Linum grandiflorum]
MQSEAGCLMRSGYPVVERILRQIGSSRARRAA